MSTSAVTLPTVTTATPTAINDTGATLGGSVTADGGASVTQRGVVYSTAQNPTVANATFIVVGSGTGSFSTVLNGPLSPGMTYYVRAFATNSAGTNYGNQVQFATTSPVTLPTVTTTAASSVTETGASTGGNVMASGGATVTQRGIVYSTSPNPTVSNATFITSGSGTGAFTTSLNGLLNPATIYYVRAFATNSAGTAYGSQVQFTTTSPVKLPTVTTATPTAINDTGATLGGSVTADGGASVTQRGVVYSTAQNPTVSNATFIVVGSGTGSFSTVLNGPLSAGTTYYVRAFATNSAGTAYGSQVQFTTTSPVTLPTVTTATPTAINDTGATLGGSVTADGGASVAQRGIVYSTAQNPTVANATFIVVGSGTGSFSTVLNGPLSPGTTYYVRAFATNSAGTNYGNQVQFATTSPVTLPTVTTTAASSVTETGASTGGNVTASGGATVTQRGIVYSTSPNPTVSNATFIASGSGTGAFTTSLNGLLNPATIYYVRAFATNSAGTAYGSQVQFTTTSPVTLPTVTTATPTAINDTGATLGGSVTADGGASVTQRGVVYSTAQNPTVANATFIVVGSGTGSFSTVLNGPLSPGMTYYVRAFATNSAGTAYGSQIQFGTPTPVTLPAVTTTAATSVTDTGASTGGNVTASGGATVTQRGIVYGTTSNPTVSNATFIVSGSGTGSFTTSLNGLLNSGTTYYVRAFATNSAGTAYGDNVSFTTAPTSSSASAINDNFDAALDTVTRWEIVGGTWSTGGGQLTGSWPQSQAYSDHGKLLLRARNLNEDFDATFVAILSNGAGHGFSLYDSANNLYNVNIANSGVWVEQRLGSPEGYPFIQIGSGAFAGSATTPTTAKLSRRGAQFSVYMNGALVFQFADPHWVGRLRTGLKTYGTAVYESYEYTPVTAVATITVAANPPVGGTVSGGGSFAVGSTQIISATANSGYTFSAWNDGNTSNPRQITVPAGGATYTANFTAVPPSDTQGPILTLGGVVVAADGKSATVSGTATDNGRGGNGVASVTLAGVSASGLPVTGNAVANWSASVPLTSGSHSISVIARDSLNNESTVPVSVTIPTVVALNPTTRNSPATAETYSIQVAANTAWTASSNQTWATVSPASGSGDGNVSVTVVTNTGAAARTAAITIGGQTHALTQSPPDATRVIGLALSNGGNFGNVTTGNTSAATLTISNTGNSPLTVSGITYPSAVFTGNWSSGTIAPSASQNVTVTFAPTAPAQPYSGTITVNSDKTSGTHTINASGTGISGGSPVTATHSVQGGGYTAGGNVTISNTITFTGQSNSTGWQVSIPDGWSYVSSGGMEANVKPTAGQTHALEWAWFDPQNSPVTFNYTMNVPAGTSGDKQFAAIALATLSGVAREALAQPDPLIVAQALQHSADTNKDWRISLPELLRVIELYNTRYTTIRTGAYKVQEGTVDGFAPDPTRTSAANVVLTRYHSGDYSLGGQFSLQELLRVIELYNYRSGTQRTGEYRRSATTVDGFAPGPASTTP